MTSDNAKSETGSKWTEVLREYMIKSKTSEPHHQHQNPAEPGGLNIFIAAPTYVELSPGVLKRKRGLVKHYVISVLSRLCKPSDFIESSSVPYMLDVSDSVLSSLLTSELVTVSLSDSTVLINVLIVSCRFRCCLVINNN